MSEIVGRGQADTVIGHTKGFSQNLVDTTLQAFDMSLYVGRYVKIRARGGEIAYCFGPLATLTTPVLVTDDAPVNTVGVCDYVSDGSYEFVVPSEEAPVLNVQGSTTNVTVKVIPK